MDSAEDPSLQLPEPAALHRIRKSQPKTAAARFLDLEAGEDVDATEPGPAPEPRLPVDWSGKYDSLKDVIARYEALARRKRPAAPPPPLSDEVRSFSLPNVQAMFRPKPRSAKKRRRLVVPSKACEKTSV